jgi:hypothetical protein
MIEMVVALCLFLNDKMIEHSHKESLSECLETKRKIERNTMIVVIHMSNVKWSKQKFM